MLFSVAPARLEDDDEILALQELNHVSALPPETLADGFVTTQLSRETLALMRAREGVRVARASDEGALLGYCCANPWVFYGEGPFQSAAKALLPFDFDGRAITAANSFQYGPVCVAGAARGQGVLAALVEATRARYAPRFEFGITFIDARNARSLAAHERKLDFRRFARLPFGSVVYHVLAFPTR